MTYQKVNISSEDDIYFALSTVRHFMRAFCIIPSPYAVRHKTKEKRTLPQFVESSSDQNQFFPQEVKSLVYSTTNSVFL